MRRVLADHRTVARERELHRLVGFATHRNVIGDDPHRLPAVAVTVARGVGRVRLVDHEVFLVGREDRQREGEVGVVAEGDAGQSRLPGADHIQPRRGQMGDVA